MCSSCSTLEKGNFIINIKKKNILYPPLSLDIIGFTIGDGIHIPTAKKDNIYDYFKTASEATLLTKRHQTYHY